MRIPICHRYKTCPAISPSGTLVDGLPLVGHTGAEPSAERPPRNFSGNPKGVLCRSPYLDARSPCPADSAPDSNRTNVWFKQRCLVSTCRGAHLIVISDILHRGMHVCWESCIWWHNQLFESPSGKPSTWLTLGRLVELARSAATRAWM